MYSVGRTVRTRNLSLRYRDKPGDGWRAAVVVSKKVHKSAVVRNRIRRRVYEVLRTEYAGRLNGAEYLLTVHHASLAVAPYGAITRELAALYARTTSGARALRSPSA